MTSQPETSHYREGLPQRLRGEWATLTTNAEADLWALRREAAEEIEMLRDALERAHSDGYDAGREDGSLEARGERRQGRLVAWRRFLAMLNPEDTDA